MSETCPNSNTSGEGDLPFAGRECNGRLVERPIAGRSLTVQGSERVIAGVIAAGVRAALALAARIAWVAPLGLALGLAACTSFVVDSIKPGMTANEVRAAAGSPSEEHKLAAGGMAWFYSQGRQGWTTWRVGFNAEGHVVESEQVLTEANFVKQIKPLYMQRDELLADFGKPNNVQVFARMGEEVWQYRYEKFTTQMLNDVHVDQSTGTVKYFHMYRDPAYTNFGGQD